MTTVLREPSFVTVGDRKLAYNEVSPPAPKGTILLLTGLAAKRYGWYHPVDEFCRYYRTIGLAHPHLSGRRHVTEAYTTGDPADSPPAALKPPLFSPPPLPTV